MFTWSHFFLILHLVVQASWQASSLQDTNNWNYLLYVFGCVWQKFKNQDYWGIKTVRYIQWKCLIWWVFIEMKPWSHLRYRTLSSFPNISSCASAAHPSASGNHWSAFYHYGIVRIFRIARKWNLIPCGLLCLSSYTKHNNSEHHPRCCIYQQLVPFYYRAIICCMDRLHFVYPFICQWTLG